MSSKLSHFSERLRSITWDEFRTRVGQEIAKRSDLLLSTRIQRSFQAEARGSGKFFFSADELDGIVAFLQRRMPEVAQATVAQAERICGHEFDLLGYEGLQYGPDIDWHLDAVSGKRAPRKPWFKIPYLDYSEVGDIKVTWELNRHQHLVTLAKAYCFTGDERFVLELVRQWYSWQENNPYPIGVNWSSSLEVALRCLSWLWVLNLLQNCPAVLSQFRADLWRTLMVSGRHIERYLSTYFSPNTHLLGEGVALFFLGVLGGRGVATDRWKQLGWDIVLTQANRQVQEDGMHFEQSTHYHVYALDMFLHARILADANAIPVTANFDCILKRMLDALRTLGCTSTPPRFGDDDGGRLFDGRRNCAEHLLDPLSVGGAFFGRTNFKAPKPGVIEETVWLLGVERASNFDAVSISPAPLESSAQQSSGLYMMISPGPPTAQLTMDAGPHGAEGGGHGHADALSIQLAIGGREVLIDPGTFVYAGPGRERQMFRGTAYHNTLQVDGIDQAEPAGPFPWRHRPDVRVENWVPGNSFDLLVATHNGYERCVEPVTHRRCVFGLKSQFWFVLDVVEGHGNHRADIFWHLSPDLRWALHDRSALASWPEGAMGVVFAKAHGWSASVCEGWYSPVYGRRTKAEVLAFRHERAASECCATVLVPLPNSTQRPGILTCLQPESTKTPLRAYRYDRSATSHFLFLAGHRPWRWQELESDAEFLYCSISAVGHKQLIICGATFLNVAARPVISCSRAVSRMEWSSTGEHSEFSSSDKDAVTFRSWDNLASFERGIREEATV